MLHIVKPNEIDSVIGKDLGAPRSLPITESISLGLSLIHI